MARIRQLWRLLTCRHLDYTIIHEIEGVQGHGVLTLELCHCCGRKNWTFLARVKNQELRVAARNGREREERGWLT